MSGDGRKANNRFADKWDLGSIVRNTSGDRFKVVGSETKYGGYLLENVVTGKRFTELQFNLYNYKRG